MYLMYYRNVLDLTCITSFLCGLILDEEGSDVPSKVFSSVFERSKKKIMIPKMKFVASHYLCLISLMSNKN